MDVKLRLRRWARPALRVLLVVVVLTAVVNLVGRLWSRQRLEREMSEIFLEGGSLQLADYLPALEEGERNASHGLDAACSLLLASTETEPFPWKELRLDTAGDAEARRASQWLAAPEHELALAILDLFAATPHAVYADVSSVTQIATAYNDYGTERIRAIRLAGLLKARAFVRLHAGDAAASYRDVALILRLANWMHDELPGHLPWLLADRVEDIGLRSLEQLQQVAPPEDEPRSLVGREIQRLEERGRSAGLEGERAYSHLAYLRSGTALPARRGRGLVVGWTHPLIEAELLDGYGKLIRQAQKDPHSRADLDEVVAGSALPFGVARFFLPNFFAGIERADLREMRRRLARVALAWEKHHAEQGAYPDDPQVLVPYYLEELPEDAFTGEPLRWTRGEDGCELKSAGPDPEDDEDDLVWRLPCGERG